MKIGIITINDYDNYGNRLQNYAVQEIIKKIGHTPITLPNASRANTKEKYFIRKIRSIFDKKYSKNHTRAKNFKSFNQLISFSKHTFDAYHHKEYCDYYVVGSDQVWNPYIDRCRELDLLTFAPKDRRIALAASFSVNAIPNGKKTLLKTELPKFKAISVREERGKEIIQELGIKQKVTVLSDPTFILSDTEWAKVTKKPLNIEVPKKYILLYFLGEISDSRLRKIKHYAKQNNCAIINILDPTDHFYGSGPSEFLYLEKNASLICTDSFHSSVFGIIFQRPFIVFDREQNGVVSMNTRIETLLKKYKLENHKYSGKLLICNNSADDYSKTKKIIVREQQLFLDFIRENIV